MKAKYAIATIALDAAGFMAQKMARQRGGKIQKNIWR